MKKSKWDRVGENLFRRLPSGKIYLRAKIAGKVVERSLGVANVRVAKKKRDVLLTELRDKAGIDRKGHQTTLSKEAALERTLEHYASLPRYQDKPASLHYRAQLIEVLRRTLPDVPPSKWTPDDLRAWWTAPEVARYSPHRRNNALGTLRQMISLLVDRGDMAHDPSVKLSRVPVPPVDIDVPNRDEFASILEDIRSQGKRASNESADFVAFLAYSGCRIAEARAVEWSHVGEEFIRITGGEARTKNGLARSVPIIGPMRALLDGMRARNDAGPLFFLKSPRFALKNACERLGLPHFTPHTMRHLFATTCIESGVDIPTVAKWLGHRDGGALAMRTYGHLRDDHSISEAGKVDF